MAHHSIVYGRIVGPTWKTDDYYKLHRINLETIASFPNEDDGDIPWINQSMFSVANEQGVFRDQVISFAASYRSLEWEWGVWLEKFESYLQQLFFYDAIIHVEFEVMGEYTYKWKTNFEDWQEHWYGENPNPDIGWDYSADGPRVFKLK